MRVYVNLERATLPLPYGVTLQGRQAGTAQHARVSGSGGGERDHVNMQVKRRRPARGTKFRLRGGLGLRRRVLAEGGLGFGHQVSAERLGFGIRMV